MCVEVRTASGGVVVLDAGTGVQALARRLAGERIRELDLLLTHLHLDHIEGLGFLTPLFDPECRVRIHGPRPEGSTLADKISTFLSPPYAPRPFERFEAEIEFIEIERDTFELGGLMVTSVPVCHPGPTLAYRLTEDERSLAFIPDNELGLDPRSGLEVAAGVDLLLHDAQYTDEEYATRVGWGHTSVSHLARYIEDATPRRIVMMHHDPAHDDAQLERLLVRARELTDRDELELGYEGLVLVPGPP